MFVMFDVSERCQRGEKAQVVVALGTHLYETLWHARAISTETLIRTQRVRPDGRKVSYKRSLNAQTMITEHRAQSTTLTPYS
jgi:hypothetical protein